MNIKNKIDEVVVSSENKAQENLNINKEQAKNELEAKGEEAKGIIESNGSLTEEQKKIIKESIDESVNKGKEAIENSVTTEAVGTEKEKGKEAVDEILESADLDTAKIKAIEELTAYANEIKEVIDNNPSLTEGEKNGYKSQIDQILSQSIVAINVAGGITDVEIITEEYKGKIDEVVVESAIHAQENLDKVKENAILELINKGEIAKKEIDNTSGLIKEKKQYFKKEIDELIGSSIEAKQDNNTIKSIKETVGNSEKTINGKIEVVLGVAGYTTEQKNGYSNTINENLRTVISDIRKVDMIDIIKSIVANAKVDMDALSIAEVKKVI